MITFSIDKNKNILFLKIIKDVTPAEINEVLPKIYELCTQLKDTFLIINDLSKMMEKPKEDLKILNQLNQKTSSNYKIGRTIRVIGKSKVNLINLSTLDKEKSMSRIYYVATMKDALALAEQNKWIQIR